MASEADKKLVTKRYYVVLALLSNASADLVIAALVRNGIRVSCLDVDGNLMFTSDDNVVHLLSLDVAWNMAAGSDARATLKNASEKIRSIIDETSVRYFSFVITDSNIDLRWHVGNCTVPKADVPVGAGPFRTLAIVK